MRTLVYETRGHWFSSGGSCVVSEDGTEVATIDLEPGTWLGGGPTWTWRGPFGAEWSMQAAGDRRYEVVRSDGVALGALTRPWLTSAMTLEAEDGRFGEVDAKGWFDRDRHVALPDGQQAVVTRETPALTLSSREAWRLDLPEGLTDPLRALVVALPLALDHRRRRQEQSS